MRSQLQSTPSKYHQSKRTEKSRHSSSEGKNIDWKVVESFGEEWNKFHTFSDEEIEKAGDEYFDIVDRTLLNRHSYAIDIGCGSGRWTVLVEPSWVYRSD